MYICADMHKSVDLLIFVVLAVLLKMSGLARYRYSMTFIPFCIYYIPYVYMCIRSWEVRCVVSMILGSPSHDHLLHHIITPG